MTRPQSRPATLMTWLAALSIALAACTSSPATTGETSAGEPASVAPASEPASGEIREQELIFAHITPESFPYHPGALELGELLEERSDGKITLEVFPAAQLGAEREIEEQILEGSIHFGVAAGALSAFAPSINVTELLGLISGQEHLQAIVEGEAAELLSAAIEEESDFKVVAWFSTGNSPIETVDQPITTPDDLEGLTLRVIENPALIDAFEALGANPTPLAFTEVYGALQTGVVDGAHLDWNAMASLKAYEVVNYATDPAFAFLAEPRPIVVSQEWWDGLNAAERELIGGAVEDAAEFERGLFVEAIEVAVQEAADAGVEFSEVDEEAFLEVLRPVWDTWAEELDAAEIIAAIQAVRP